MFNVFLFCQNKVKTGNLVPLPAQLTHLLFLADRVPNVSNTHPGDFRHMPIAWKQKQLEGRGTPGILENRKKTVPVDVDVTVAWTSAIR